MKKYICDACPECELWDDDYGCQQEALGGECPTLETPSINQNPVREIVFRGKQVNDGMWIQGYLFQFWGRAYILWGMTNDTPTMHEVKPETIGQFTGLTDKNGKRIFDGDIFTSDYFKDGLEFEVVFSNGSFCGKAYRTGIFPLGWQNDYYETGDDDDDFYYPEDYTSHIQIIGNIHDNPELMEARR